MHRMALVATQDFTFKGRSYVAGDRFDLPVGDAFKVVSRRQAKRASMAVPSLKAAPPEPIHPEQSEAIPPRRRRRKAPQSDEAVAAVPVTPDGEPVETVQVVEPAPVEESAWNSES